VTVALANKMARIAWALMARKEVYHVKGGAGDVPPNVEHGGRRGRG
jgi:hypothetical protein